MVKRTKVVKKVAHKLSAEAVQEWARLVAYALLNQDMKQPSIDAILLKQVEAEVITDVLLESGIIVIPSPFTPLNLNIPPHIKYQMEEFKTIIFDRVHNLVVERLIASDPIAKKILILLRVSRSLFFLIEWTSKIFT